MILRPGDRSDPIVWLVREPGERRVKNESDLFYRLKTTLQDLGEDVIKKEMVKDGHLTSDGVYYVRSRKHKAPGAFAIYDGQYMVRNSAEDYNKAGMVKLDIMMLSSTRGRPSFWSHPYGHGVFEGSEIRRKD